MSPPGRPGKSHLSEQPGCASSRRLEPGSAARPQLPCPAAQGGFSPRVCDPEPGRRQCRARAWLMCAFQGVPSPDISRDEPRKAGSGQWPPHVERRASQRPSLGWPHIPLISGCRPQLHCAQKTKQGGRWAGHGRAARRTGGQQEGRAGLRRAARIKGRKKPETGGRQPPALV